MHTKRSAMDGKEYAPVRLAGGQNATLNAYCPLCDHWHGAGSQCLPLAVNWRKEDLIRKSKMTRWIRTYKKLAWRWGEITPEQRQRIFKRASGRCEDCGGRTPRTDANVHHVRPRYAGGLNDDGNLVYVCIDCHAKRHECDGLDKLVRLQLAPGGIRDRNRMHATQKAAHEGNE